MLVRRAFQYRLYPTAAQTAGLATVLWRCRELYNACLEERIAAHKHGVSANVYSQKPGTLWVLPGIKEVRPEYALLNSQMLQDVVYRVDRAFQGFYRRVKTGLKGGFPRFRGRDRYDSFTLTQTGWKIMDGRLSLTGIGALKVRWSRPIAGTIKTVTIRRDADQWYVCFSCVVAMPDPIAEPAKPAVGIDLGLEHFATLSAGTHIANPRHFRGRHGVLIRRSRSLARKKHGSKRRRTARLLVAKAHRKVRNQRRDFHHKAARTLVRTHGLIAVEALQTAHMVRRPKPQPAATEDGVVVYLPNGAAAKAGLNKSIHDAGWATFIGMLRTKAEEAGCVVIAVNPAGTSQACSQCGAVCPKALSTRWHYCAHCRCSLQRDVNAARNILARAGQALQAGA